MLETKSPSNTDAPRRYVSDGTFSIVGVCFAVFASIVSAFGIGAVVGSVAPATNLVFMLPILVAGTIGVVQLLIVSGFKIRSPFVGLVTRLLSGLVCVVAMDQFGRDQFAQAIANNQAQLWPLTSHWFYWGIRNLGYLRRWMANIAIANE